MSVSQNGNVINFEYKNSPYTYNFASGIYFFELFGASGGGSMPGGGSYVAGNIRLRTRTKLYIYVGQKGYDGNQSAFNGGGFGGSLGSGGGGGSTDIRIKGGNWDDFESLKSRIIVAGSGGGSQLAEYFSKGGNAGIFSGNSGNYASTNGDSVTVATGGKQTQGGSAGSGSWFGEPGSFGKGGNSYIGGNFNGGGSGYFGGGAGATSFCTVGSGGGGSSFVSGLNGCRAIIKSSTNESLLFYNHSFHYSGLYFTNITYKDGSSANWNNGKVTVTLIARVHDEFFTCKSHYHASMHSFTFFSLIVSI